MASRIAFFIMPTSLLGCKLKCAMIISPVIGGCQFRMWSFSSTSAQRSITISKLDKNRFTFSLFLEVMSARQSVNKDSKSSPASKINRLTAESVIFSLVNEIGRRCNSTIFRTNFIFSFRGSLSWVNILGTILPPTTSCP